MPHELDEVPSEPPLIEPLTEVLLGAEGEPVKAGLHELLRARDEHDPLFLQFKEANASVLEEDRSLYATS